MGSRYDRPRILRGRCSMKGVIYLEIGLGLLMLTSGLWILALQNPRSTTQVVPQRINRLTAQIRGAQSIVGITSKSMPLPIQRLKQASLMTLVGVVASWVLRSTPLALLGPLLGFIIAAPRPKRRAKDRAALIQRWPEVLEDMRIRVGSLGRPLPQSFFESTRSFPGQATEKFRQAERLWILGGSFTVALDHLEASLADAASTAIFQTLRVCASSGSGDIASRLERLRDTREAERALLGEINARLGAVRLARAFIVIVPGAMGGVGYLFAGSLQSFLSAPALAAEAVAALAMVGCWVWSSSLMRPPSMISGTSPGRPFQLPRVIEMLTAGDPK